MTLAAVAMIVASSATSEVASMSEPRMGPRSERRPTPGRPVGGAVVVMRGIPEARHCQVARGIRYSLGLIVTRPGNWLAAAGRSGRPSPYDEGVDMTLAQ